MSNGRVVAYSGAYDLALDGLANELTALKAANRSNDRVRSAVACAEEMVGVARTESLRIQMDYQRTANGGIDNTNSVSVQN